MAISLNANAPSQTYRDVNCLPQAATITLVALAVLACAVFLYSQIPIMPPHEVIPLIAVITLIALTAITAGLALFPRSQAVEVEEDVEIAMEVREAFTVMDEHPFTHASSTPDLAAYVGHLRITTANLGMLPSTINFFQRTGRFFTGIFSEHTDAILSPASERGMKIAEQLAREADDVSVLCCQEVFDVEAAGILAEKLRAKGYHVLHSGGAGWRFVNSGLFFASRYSIQPAGVRFWHFNELIYSDAFSSKGVLRVPLEVPCGTQLLTVIMYVTHLQAELDAHPIRKEQLNAILSQIAIDQKDNSGALIFLAGDLNITDMEYGQIAHGEYTQNASFFTSFHDFVDLIYGKDGLRRSGTPQYLQGGTTEPNGTFYLMDQFGTGAVSPGCLYDRILLYKHTHQEPVFHTEIRRTMEPDLSDHLPVTLHVDLSAYMNAH